jgi:hypothetical protein
METHIKPTSQSLRDYGQYQRGAMLMVFCVSGIYWSLARYVDAPVFDQDQYGWLIMSVTAETWLAPLFFASGAHLVAQVINGDPRLPPLVTPIIRMVSATVVAADLMLFAVGGMFAPYYDLYFAYSGAVGLVSLWFAWLGFCDVKRGLQVARGAS